MHFSATIFLALLINLSAYCGSSLRPKISSNSLSDAVIDESSGANASEWVLDPPQTPEESKNKTEDHNLKAESHHNDKMVQQAFAADASQPNTLTSPEAGPELAQNLDNALVEDIIAAEARPSCSDVIHSYMTHSAHQGKAGKNWLESFKSLWTTALKPLHKDSDKDAVAALYTLSAALQHSGDLDFRTLHSLVTCDVDGMGRTILMKLIEHGFVKSLQSPLCWSLFNPYPFDQLMHCVDKEGNNLLHLAVASRSSSVVQQVLFSLEARLDTDQLRAFFDNKNKIGSVPLDVARQPSMPPDILSIMKSFYRAHYHGEGAKSKRDLIIHPHALPIINV